MLIISRATQVTVGPSPQARTSLTINHFHPEIEWIFLQNKYLLGISDEVGSVRWLCHILLLNYKSLTSWMTFGAWKIEKLTGKSQVVTSMTWTPTPISHQIAQIHSTQWEVKRLAHWKHLPKTQPPPLHSAHVTRGRDSQSILRMINQHRFVQKSEINCNHHLADVESLDIEIKHKKREEKANWKNYLKKSFFASLFLLRSLFTRSERWRKKNQVLHKQARTKISRTQHFHTRKFTLFLVQVQGLRGCVSVDGVSVSYHFRCFSLSPAYRQAFCIESRFQYQIMTDFLFVLAVYLAKVPKTNETRHSGRRYISAMFHCTDSHGHSRYYIISAIFHVPSCSPIRSSLRRQKATHFKWFLILDSPQSSEEIKKHHERSKKS